ncbi:MAG: hypothetical protein V4602_05285 [Pseudomonadota bacterium]
MPQFFFEITNGITLEDPTGLWCRDEADARVKGVVIAERVAMVEAEIGGPRRHISVRDDHGREVHSIVVRDRPQPLRP